MTTWWSLPAPSRPRRRSGGCSRIASPLPSTGRGAPRRPGGWWRKRSAEAKVKMRIGHQGNLPKYVRLSHGAYYYVRWNPTEKKVIWKPLGATYGKMLLALSELQDDDVLRMEAILDLYEREILPGRAANTRKQQTWQLKKLRASFGRMTPDSVTPRHVYRYLD